MLEEFRTSWMRPGFVFVSLSDTQVSELNLANRFGLEAEVSEHLLGTVDTSSFSLSFPV
jgi:hypothetical protein